MPLRPATPTPSTVQGAPTLPAPPSRSNGQKWAIAIGINDYQNADVSDLRLCEKDAQDVADSLIRQGDFASDHVLVLKSQSATRANIIRQIANLSKKVKANDTFVLFFSGHSTGDRSESANKNLLVTADADPSDEQTLKATSLSPDDLRSLFQGIPAERVLLLLDTHGNKLFTRQLLSAAWSARGGTAQAAVVMGSSDGEKAWEAPKQRNGVFTSCLLEGLGGKAANAARAVTWDSLMAYLQQAVPQAPGGTARQHIQWEQSLSSEFVFSNR